MLPHTPLESLMHSNPNGHSKHTIHAFIYIPWLCYIVNKNTFWNNNIISGKNAPVTISFCLCITFTWFHFNNQVHTDFLNCWMKTFAHIYSGKWVVFCWHTRGHQLLLWTWDSGNAEANDPQIPTPSAQALQPGILESLTGFPPVASCIKVNKSATSQRNPWSWHAFHFHCEVYFKKDMWMTTSKCITLFRVVLNRCYINNP